MLSSICRFRYRDPGSGRLRLGTKQIAERIKEIRVLEDGEVIVADDAAIDGVWQPVLQPVALY